MHRVKPVAVVAAIDSISQHLKAVTASKSPHGHPNTGLILISEVIDRQFTEGVEEWKRRCMSLKEGRSWLGSSRVFSLHFGT
jgi:hypothetical protein